MNKCFKLEYSVIKNGLPEYNKTSYTTAQNKKEALRNLKWKIGKNNRVFDITVTECDK